MSILPVERHDIYIARKVINHTERRPETRHQTFQAPNSSPEMSTEILDLKKKRKKERKCQDILIIILKYVMHWLPMLIVNTVL